MNKKQKPISIPTLLVGLFFLAAYIAAMFTICHFSHIFELEAQEAYVTRGGSGEANYAITQEWKAKEAMLGLYSHVVFGVLLLLALVAFFLLIKFSKIDKKIVVREGFSFIRVFFAMTLADLALMFNIGSYVSFTSWSDSVWEYIIYTMECLIVIEFVALLVDKLSYKKKGFSILFERVGTKEIVFTWVSLVSTLILSLFFLVTLMTRSEPFPFVFFAFFAVPAMGLYEIAFHALNAINYFTEPKTPVESQEEF